MAWASRQSSARKSLSVSIDRRMPSRESSPVWAWGSTLWPRSSRAMGEPSRWKAKSEKDRPLRSLFLAGKRPDFCHHLIANHPNRLNLHLDNITCPQKQGRLASGSNARWRPGRDQISGFQSHKGTKKGNSSSDRENHL